MHIFGTFSAAYLISAYTFSMDYVLRDHFGLLLVTRL